MLLDDLVSVIETLKERMRRHRSTLQGNEMRTRMALIDPLLTALGWDTSDPSLVTPEYAVGEGRADYALHGSEHIPAAMVEAKRLGHSLSDDERMQMLNYANARGVRYAAVTDGDAWEFYEVFKQAPLEDRRLLKLRIADRPAHELALQLLLIWRPNLASGQPTTANQPLFDWTTVPQPAVTVEPETPPVTETLQQISAETATIEQGWVSLPDFNPPGGSKPPTAIRFPDGTETSIDRWKRIPKAVADWLYDKQLLTPETVPIVSGKRRFAANDKPVMHDGRPMIAHEAIGNDDIFIDVDLSANSARRHARKMLEHCGVNPVDVRVRVG